MQGEVHLNGLHPKLVELARLVDAVMPMVVVDGMRTIEEQKINVLKKVSKTMASKHLPQEDGFSHAFDLAPAGYDGKINWKDTEAFCVLAGVVKTYAHELGVKIRWGGDWDSDMSTTDETFRDYGHFELVP